MTDRLLQLVANLPHAELSRTRADRIRSRCHEMLGRRHRRTATRRPGRRIWEPLVAGLGGLYLAAAIVLALEIYGVL
jgi:hypothetical protein